MIPEQQRQLSRLLTLAAESLDIPPAMREMVEASYRDVCEHLQEKGTALAHFDPDLYSQGSYMLGTETAPPGHKSDHDIDMVCQLAIPKERVSQLQLKTLVGERLGERSDFRCILEEKRRCWRLNFNDGFHMDVLPAIPDVEGRESCILITDRELRRWQFSNPRDYGNWFRDQMKVEFERRRKLMAESIQMSMDEIPYYQVKTPLQRAIQILKRHRDIYFDSDDEHKPVSIILTTLAAKAYSNEEDLYAALIAITKDMPRYIKGQPGNWQVLNPVYENDPTGRVENFADKWNEEPVKHETFVSWLKKVESDFAIAAESRGPDLYEGLKAILGSAPIENATAQLGMTSRRDRDQGQLRMVHGSGAIVEAGGASAASATLVRKHTFYGDSTTC